MLSHVVCINCNSYSASMCKDLQPETLIVGLKCNQGKQMMTNVLRTFSSDSKFDECFKRFVVECEFVEKFLFYY